MSLCMWCQKPATHYCDAVIGVEAVDAIRDKNGNVTQLLTGLDATQWTCDAPMCDEHTHQIGHISGKAPESIDHCPHHATHREQPFAAIVMFANEVDAARRAVYAAIRRALIQEAATRK